MATSTHSIKRAFRHDPKHNTAISQLPTLPAKIQTSLLSVGMRVRKSVSDGYQTASKLPKTDITRDDSSIRTYHRTQGSLPCCGILRTGNIQPEHHPEALEEEDIPALDRNSDRFPSSQESTASISTVASSTSPSTAKAVGKRCYEDEDELVLPSPLGSHPPQQITIPNSSALRPILQPKTRKVGGKVPAKDLQESTSMMDIDDFEEASFLHFEDD